MIKDKKDIKDKKNIDEIIELAWELSMNDRTASYGRMKSKDEVKIAIDRAMKRDDINIIASYYDDNINGVCIYIWKDKENYAQTDLFVIKENYEQTASKMLDYIKKHLAGYDFFAGFSAYNLAANKYFANNNFECIESSIAANIILPINNGNYLLHKNIEEIGIDDFDKYAVFHDKYATDMYYNSKNIKKDINIFKILAYKENEEIYGSIFFKCFNDISDVFGLFIDDRFKGKGIESILVNHMLSQLNALYKSSTEVLYFIDDDSTDEFKEKILEFLYCDEMYNAILIELIQNNINSLGELYINENDKEITEVLHIKNDGNSNFTNFIYSSEKGLGDIAFKIKELAYKKVLLAGKSENVKSLLGILGIHKDIEPNIFYKLDLKKYIGRHIKYCGKMRLASSNIEDLQLIKHFTSQFLEAETKEEIEAVTDTEKTLAKIKSGVYILEYKNNPIGMARFIGKTNNFAEITSVYIDKAYRKKGFGKELIGHMIEIAVMEQRTPILATSTLNISALRTYEAMGFERQSEYAYEFLD